MRSVYWPVVLNVVGIAAAFLYGLTGGSGGETTEGVFMTFALTGWLTIFLALGLLVGMLLRKKVAALDTALLVVVAVVAFFETRLFAFEEMMF